MIVAVVFAVVALAVIAAISGDNDDEPDGGATLACRHFRNAPRCRSQRPGDGDARRLVLLNGGV